MIAIRPLTLDQVDDWVSLRIDALEQHPLAFGSSVPDKRETLVEFAVTRVTENESVIMMAYDEGIPVGTVGMYRGSGKKERHKAHVWGMFVQESHRRRRIGLGLLESAISRAADWRGVEAVQLSVSETSTGAHALYQQLGFVAWGREPRALLWNGEAPDEIHMALDLRRPSTI
jgi:GNAT superfamily N-acetyltransferase